MALSIALAIGSIICKSRFIKKSESLKHKLTFAHLSRYERALHRRSLLGRSLAHEPDDRNDLDLHCRRRLQSDSRTG